jgi:hypothetical protein
MEGRLAKKKHASLYTPGNPWHATDLDLELTMYSYGIVKTGEETAYATLQRATPVLSPFRHRFDSMMDHLAGLGHWLPWRQPMEAREKQQGMEAVELQR